MRFSSASTGRDRVVASGDGTAIDLVEDAPKSASPLLSMPLVTALAGLSTVLAVAVVDQLDRIGTPSPPSVTETAPADDGAKPPPRNAAVSEQPATQSPPAPAAPFNGSTAPRMDAVLDAGPGPSPQSPLLSVRVTPSDLRADGRLSVAIGTGASTVRLEAAPPPVAATPEPVSLPLPAEPAPPVIPVAEETRPVAPTAKPDRSASPRSGQDRAARSIRKPTAREPETTGSAPARAKSRRPAVGPKGEPAPSPTPFSLPGALRPGGS